MASAQSGDFGWFTTWVHQNVGASLCFARGISVSDLLERFDFDGRPGLLSTWEETVQRGQPALRVGEHAGWAWAVGYLTLVAADEGALRRLSADGGAAFALTFTETISTLMYAEDTTIVFGVDLTVPHIRYGSEPHRFDREIELARLAESSDDLPGRAAHLVQLALGLTIEQPMIEGAQLTVAEAHST